MLTTAEPGGVTTSAYEGDERIRSTVTDSLGNATVYDVHHINGLVESVTDADGVLTDYQHDAVDRHAEESSPLQALRVRFPLRLGPGASSGTTDRGVQWVRVSGPHHQQRFAR